MQRGRGLGPGVAAADHDERAPLDLLLFGGGGIGQLHLSQHMIVQVDRLGQHLHPTGIALQPGDVEGASHVARGEHQQVEALHALAGGGELIRLGFLAQRTGTLADFEHTDAGLNQEETKAALTAAGET